MRLILSFLLILIVSAGSAQQSLLIQITSPEGGKPSYIFTANNNALVTQYDFETILSHAANNVNAIAFEWLPENYELDKILEVMKNEEDKTLLKYYKREDNIRYELMIINKLQEDVEKYWNLQPLYTMQAFRNKDYADGFNYQQDILREVALRQTKPVISLMNLRTIREQMRMIDFETQAAILNNYVNKEATFKVYEDEKWRFYEKQNLEGFYKAMSEIEHPVYLETIITRRASLIVDKIQALSAQQSTLYFLDASIVGGYNGVLQKLKGMNFVIEDIPVVLAKRVNGADIDLEFTETQQTDAFPE
ncbi:MAG: TraB/GumN family protein, partial [Chitinophagales bacterium]